MFLPKVFTYIINSFEKCPTFLDAYIWQFLVIRLSNKWKELAAKWYRCFTIFIKLNPFYIYNMIFFLDRWWAGTVLSTPGSKT